VLSPFAKILAPPPRGPAATDSSRSVYAKNVSKLKLSRCARSTSVYHITLTQANPRKKPFFVKRILYVAAALAALVFVTHHASAQSSTDSSFARILTFTEGSGVIQKSPEKSTYASGEQVTLTATPNRYYRFISWSDGSIMASRILTIRTNGTYVETAFFTKTVPLEIHPYTRWSQTFGSDSIQDIRELPSSDLIAGGVARFGAGHQNTSTGFGASDYWFLRLDPNGRRLQDFAFGGSAEDVLQTVAISSAGTILLAGASVSDASGNKETPLQNGGCTWLVSVDQHGAKLWEYQLDESPSIISAEPVSSGGFLVTRAHVSTGPALVYRLSENGTKLLQWTLLGFGASTAAETLDGGFLIASGLSKAGYEIAKLGSFGGVVWKKTYDQRQRGAIQAIVPCSDGGFLLAGTSEDLAGDPARSSPGRGGLDFWLVRIDSSGGELWDKTFGGNGSDQLQGATRTSDGGFLLFGYSSYSPASNEDAFFGQWYLRLDSAGRIVWKKPIEGFSLQRARLSAAGDILLCGKYNTPNGAFVSRIAELSVPVGAPLLFLEGNLVGSTNVSITNSVQLTFTTAYANGAIFFSLDGSAPTLSSTRFTSPLAITKSTTVRAIAYSADFRSSAERDPISITIGPSAPPIPPVTIYPLVALTPGGGTVHMDSLDGRYPSNAVAHLISTPFPGWQFINWTGDSVSTNSTLDLLMDRAKSVQSLFGTTVSTTAAGAGSVTLAPAQPPYPYGATVTASAVPQPGFYLAAWGNAATGTNNPYKLRVAVANPVISAAFLPKQDQLIAFPPMPDHVLGDPPFALRATSSSGLSVSFSVVSGPAVINNNILTITGAGRVFVRASQPGSTSYNPSPDIDLSFNVFLLVNVSGTEGGFVSQNPSLINYQAGEVISLIATPDPGYAFTGWTGSFTSALPTLTITLTNNLQLVGHFARLFQLQTHIIGDGAVSVTPLATYYLAGTPVQLSAAPTLGNTFSGWSGNASGNAPSITLLIDTNKEVTASFTAVADTAPSVVVSTVAGSGIVGNLDNANALSAQLNRPDGPSIGQDGTIYFADTGNDEIRAFTTSGAVARIAGAGLVGYLDDIGTNALFSFPVAARVLAGGDILVADAENDVIRRISADRSVRTYAGDGARGYVDGPTNSASFAFPNDLVEAANGFIYVTEFLNHVVRKISPSGGVSTFVGNGTPGYVDGKGTTARFNQPAGIAIAADGTLFVTDWGNNRIRKIAMDGTVTTFAGSGIAGLKNGAGEAAQFSAPNGIAVGLKGELYVTENMNHVIRRISPLGVVSTLAGTGRAGFADGDGLAAMFNTPSGLALASDGSLIVTDSLNQRLRKITFAHFPTLSLQLVPALGDTPTIQLQAKGDPQATISVQTSSDLRTWVAAKQTKLDLDGTATIFGNATAHQQFYRAVLLTSP
jgi:sugar lactone lactonase YvrE